MKLFNVLLTIVLSIVLVGCSADTTTVSKEMQSSEPAVETDAEIKEAAKTNAKEVTFIDVGADKYEEQSYFKLTGEVSAVGVDSTGSVQEFMLSVDEGDGYGVYTIQSVPPTIDSEMSVEEGDTITIYGKYQGKDAATSMPVVFAQVFEK